MTGCPEVSLSIIFGPRVVCQPTISSARSLRENDLEVIVSVEHTRMTQHLCEVLPTSSASASDVSADTFWRLGVFIASYGTGRGRYDVLQQLTANGFGSGSGFVREILPGAGNDDDDATFAPTTDISAVVVVDPLSLAGQRASSILQLFREQLRIPVTLVLTPMSDYTAFPLQSFYRFTTGLRGGAVSLTALPRQHTLTVRVDHPEMWNVQAVESGHDLDNLGKILGPLCTYSSTTHEP